MKFCVRCGRELGDGEDVCPECGMNQVTKVALNLDKRKGNKWIIALAVCIASAVLFFCLAYYFNFYFAFVFLPLIFLGRGATTTLDYIIIGFIIGLIIGCFLGILFRFIPM